jgi:hypothetical protein
MSIRWKARIVHAALLVLALWPIVHIALAWRYDISTWKLAGWGMYSTPRFGMIGMEVYGRDPAVGQWEQLVAPSAEVQTIAVVFLERHRWLRRLAGADDLIAAVGRTHPQWDALRIVVAYPHIDLDTGMVVLGQDERSVRLR